MNLFGLSPGELLLIMMVAMIVLGPEKLPEVAASLGRWVREFRRATEELSAQFAGDNPLLELQRALSLTDEPAPPPPAPETAAQPDLSYTPSETSVSTTLATSTPAPQISTPVRHDYFTYPQTYPSISDAWTHGSLPENPSHNGRAVLADGRFISDEWTHGVPVAPSPGSVDDDQAATASPAAEPVPGVAAHVEFDPALPRDTTHDIVSETVSPSGDGIAGDLNPLSSPERSPETTEAVDASVEMPSPTAASPNGTANHPVDTVPDPVPAAASERREGDAT